MEQDKQKQLRKTPSRSKNTDLSYESVPSPSFNAVEASSRRVRRNRKNVFNNVE
jgi:hypothetical protein